MKGSWGQDGIRIHYHIVFCFDNLMWGLHTTENPIGMPLHFAANWKAVEMCNNGRLGAMRTANFGGSVSAQGWKIGSRTERSKAWFLSVSIVVCIVYSMYVCHIYRDGFLLPNSDDSEYYELSIVWIFSTNLWFILISLSCWCWGVVIICKRVGIFLVLRLWDRCHLMHWWLSGIEKDKRRPMFQQKHFLWTIWGSRSAFMNI